MECIVKFGAGGDVLETRRNYTLDRLTQTINSLVPKGDELMNVIEISKKGVLKYEFIMRDGDLNRFVVLVNDEGVVERVITSYSIHYTKLYDNRFSSYNSCFPPGKLICPL